MYKCSTAIVNRSHFHSCGPVVSTSVAQLTKMCRPVGCRPVGLSPTCLSPRSFVAQMTGDRPAQGRWLSVPEPWTSNSETSTSVRSTSSRHREEKMCTITVPRQWKADDGITGRQMTPAATVLREIYRKVYPCRPCRET